MADITETSEWASTVHLIATTDPVQGGDETALSNQQAKALADRTLYLKGQVDNLNTEVGNIQSQLAAAPTTPAAGDDGQEEATTAFVHRAAGGGLSVDVSGNANVVLISDEWGVARITLIGALTGDIAVIFPNRDDIWLVANNTTGAYDITLKTVAGSGVLISQTRSKFIYCDATNIYDAQTDVSTRPRTITAETTLANGDEVFADQSGGTFPVHLPVGPSEGDKVTIRGNFATSNLTVTRNGQSIRDKDGVPQAQDYLIDRNNASDVFTFMAGAWMVTQG